MFLALELDPVKVPEGPLSRAHRAGCAALWRLQGESEGQHSLCVLGSLVWEQLLDILSFTAGLCKSRKMDPQLNRGVEECDGTCS